MSWNATIWTFKTKNFRVTLAIEPEDQPDISWDETGETAEKLASGEWECVTFVLSVYWKGQRIAQDCLGNSIYADVSDFRREHIGAQGKHGSYFRDMITTACSEAREEIARLRRDLPTLRAA